MMCTDPKKVALNRRSPEPMPPLDLNGEVPPKKRWPRKKQHSASVIHRVEFLEAQYGFSKFLVEEKIPSMDAIIMQQDAMINQQDAMINQMYHEMQRMRHMLHCMAMANTTVLQAMTESSVEVNPNGASILPLPREPEFVID